MPIKRGYLKFHHNTINIPARNGKLRKRKFIEEIKKKPTVALYLITKMAAIENINKVVRNSTD